MYMYIQLCVNIHTYIHTHTHTHFYAGSELDGLGGDSYTYDLGDPFDDPSGTEQSGEDQVFSIEEELRFAIQFDEGYDLFDPKYEARLKIHHPKSANKSQLSALSY